MKRYNKIMSVFTKKMAELQKLSDDNFKKAAKLAEKRAVLHLQEDDLHAERRAAEKAIDKINDFIS